MILASTSMQLWKLLLLAFFLIGYAVYKTIRQAGKHPIKDDFMQLGIFLAIPKDILYFWGPLAIAILSVTVILAIMLDMFSWPKLRDHSRTGNTIDRKPLNK